MDHARRDLFRRPDASRRSRSRLVALRSICASFLSQFLLAAPITARASVIPFLLVQVAVAWAWYALHVRRLRDAGRPTGAAIALTILYALAIVLLLLVMLRGRRARTAAGTERNCRSPACSRFSCCCS